MLINPSNVLPNYYNSFECIVLLCKLILNKYTHTRQIGTYHIYNLSKQRYREKQQEMKKKIILVQVMELLKVY